MRNADEIIAAIAKVKDPELRKQMMKDFIEANSDADDRKEQREAAVGGYRPVAAMPKDGIDYKFDAREPGEVSFEEASAIEQGQRRDFRGLPVKRTPVE